MLNTEIKLKLEALYHTYCMSDLIPLTDYYLSEIDKEDKEDLEMMKQFVKFRLRVSGGNKYECSHSMSSVDNFLDEICLYDDMMSDWSGDYRGTFSWEHLECLSELVNNIDLDEKLKHDIIEGYRTRCNLVD
jgi:hypothetical protein